MIDKRNINFNCPLALPAISFAIGIVSSRYLSVLPDYSFPVALILCITLLFSRSLAANTFNRSLFIFTIFFMVGNIHLYNIQSTSQNAPVSEPLMSDSNEFIVYGRLKNAPSYNGRNGKFLLVADRIQANGQPERRLASRILFRTTFKIPEDIEPGTRLLIRATLSRPLPPGTPGTFDYRQYLMDQSIQLTGFIRSDAYLTAIYNTDAPDNLLTSLSFLPQLLRHRANKTINGLDIPDRRKGIYKAIITGERHEMSPIILDNFKRSGAIHLLAISGMHMALLALICAIIFNFIIRRSETLMLRWPTRKISALIALLIMAVYATISGMQPPVVRSFIMAAFLIIAFVIDRPGSLLNVLSLAALFILTCDPVSLFSASFQMSFAAVAGIIFFADNIQNKKEEIKKESLFAKIKRPVIATIYISIIALMATAPISIYHFHQISILSPLTTLLTAPLICFWALPLGLAGLIFSMLSPELGAIFFKIGSYGLASADYITSFFASFPHVTNVLTPPTLFRIALYYIIAGSLLLRPRTNLAKGITAITLILLMVIPSAGFYFKDMNGPTMATFIDIGQGSSTLLELPGNMNILLDGGGSASERFDPGEQIIAPLLWHKKIKKLHAVVITHAHQDHYNGLEFIIRNFKPEVVWVNSLAARSIAYQNILKLAESSGATIKIPEIDSLLFSSAEARLICLSDLHLRRTPDLAENSRSLVIRLQAQGLDIVFPGDIEVEDGDRLIEQTGSFKSDILLAPHHGSRFSASYQLVRETKPEWVVVSASEYKKDFFPDPDFADWLEEKKIKMLTTGDYGSITFSVSDDGKTEWQPISPKGLAKLATGL